ncbi:MAG: PilZ domain-containing protein [bacterium]
MIEQRSKPRVTLESTVVFNELVFNENAKKKYFSQLVNISKNGLLMIADEFYEVGTLLDLSLYMGRWQKYSNDFFKFDQSSVSKPLVCAGKISRIYQIENEKRFYIGVTFTNIDLNEWEAFGRYLMDLKEKNFNTKEE